MVEFEAPMGPSSWPIWGWSLGLAAATAAALMTSAEAVLLLERTILALLFRNT